ncbi:hypothetical protein GCM10010254_01510 [Streptomyces chromofuscus]|uniref:Uncharacterized protein n=1 Tax=Streptomyces chromofuscus TaxID=42881 RepID=A0A7M2T0M8_STRCW|nr:hypothetical protein [Streptomyces chromofuscus]QOV42112.1 hypothetical protein IPT68_19825 [Streptomyces chromofuscus]GGS85487.1 hypothetical protein GCM10010254_01510 [Streptomyces chromofuscus]
MLDSALKQAEAERSALVEALSALRCRGPPPECLCRTVLERAFSKAAWLRLHRAGLAEHEAEKTVAGAVTLMEEPLRGPTRTADQAPDLVLHCRGGGI